MSDHLAIVLEQDTLRVFGRAAAAPLLEAPWDPDLPDAAIRTLSAKTPAPSAITLIVGLAWLDIAQPSLPPVSPAVQRRMLRLAADRWFALSDPAAFAVLDDVAFAVSARLLERWRSAFGTWAQVVAVVTLPHAAWLMNRDGQWRAEAGVGERGAISVRGGRLVEVRRTRREVEASDPLDLRACAGAVLETHPIPSSLQLLDAPTEAALASGEQRQWWRAAAVLLIAASACVWAVDAARARKLAATEALVTRLEVEAAAGRAANNRLQRAVSEQDALAADQLRSAGNDAPIRVLARLGVLLPTDAFVQRLEWDGSQWRIDGSATDAAAIVPRLDADAAIVDVQSLAPSTRFLDSGRPRNSFSIGFRVQGGG